MDIFVVPTIGFHGIVIMRLDRRRLLWTNVTANPTAEWIARQITEAFPWKRLTISFATATRPMAMPSPGVFPPWVSVITQ